jgi:hypothetical protein
MDSDSLTAPGVIDWIFFLLSATIVWQLQLPEFFAGMVRSLGAESGSPLFHIFVDILPPVLLVGIAWGTTQIYKNILWPRIPSSNYRNGWWVYVLIAYGEEGEEPTTVAGHFYLEHTPESIEIPDGKAYIVDNGEIIEERGNWSSDTVWISEKSVKTIFNMNTVNEAGLPENYEGLIDMNSTLDEPIIGESTYEGRFYDLDRGNMVLGQIYAERIDIGEYNNRQKVYQSIAENTGVLVERCNFGPTDI